MCLSCRDTLTGKHPVQLSEWWADFDERVMRPVFNKPDAMGEWTPRAEGAPIPSSVDLCDLVLCMV